MSEILSKEEFQHVYARGWLREHGNQIKATIEALAEAVESCRWNSEISGERKVEIYEQLREKGWIE